MIRRGLVIVALGLGGFVAGCEEGASPVADAQAADAQVADAQVADAGRPDAADHLPSDCDNVFYWCEEGKVYMGRPRWPFCELANATCDQDAPGWYSVQLVGMCESSCGVSPSGQCGLSCETNNGTPGCYAEDATASLCAAAP